MASSIASLVPEPIEKCAVALASPISTMLSCGPALAADGREIAPERAVDDQLVAGELLGEHAFEEMRRRRLVQLVEAGALERLRIGLHHPGRAARLVLIAMRDEDAVLGLLEEELEGVERPGRAHPGELVGPQLDARLERVLERLAGARIDAVGRDDQVGAAGRRLSADRPPGWYLISMPSECARRLQNLQQHGARASRRSRCRRCGARCRGSGSRCRPSRRSGR